MGLPVGLRSYSIDLSGLRLVARRLSYKLAQMNMAQAILPGDRAFKKRLSIDSQFLNAAGPFRFARHLGRALNILGAVAVVALVGMLSPAAFGANPAEEMFKTGATTGGTDPHGNSWLSIQHSVQQFAHPEFLLRLLLSFTLAVGCAWIIAWHPRR